MATPLKKFIVGVASGIVIVPLLWFSYFEFAVPQLMSRLGLPIYIGHGGISFSIFLTPAMGLLVGTVAALFSWRGRDISLASIFFLPLLLSMAFTAFGWYLVAVSQNV